MKFKILGSVLIFLKLENKVRGFIEDEKGEFVSTIGWMAIMATVLVLTHGLITGWLPDFVNRVFDRMDTLV